MVQIVGILNITPDSFSDGNMFMEPRDALAQAQRLLNDGADMIDVGAESTRPGATPLKTSEEWQRLEPVLKQLVKHLPGRLSLDTYHPEIAAKALALGEVIINDVTGMNNPAMVELVSSYPAKCIISHLIGTDIQAAHRGELLDDITVVHADLMGKARLLEAQGVPHDHIILDPGIGFGKTPELNWKLVSFARLTPDYPVMIGYSRKRFLGDKRMELAPNLMAGRKAVQAGAAYLRVHDVAGHRSL